MYVWFKRIGIIIRHADYDMKYLILFFLRNLTDEMLTIQENWNEKNKRTRFLLKKKKLELYLKTFYDCILIIIICHE